MAIWVFVLSVMFLHHAFGPYYEALGALERPSSAKSRSDEASPRRRRPSMKLALRIVLPVAVFLPIASMILQELRYRIGYRDDLASLKSTLIILERLMGWALVLLIPFVAGIGLHRLLTRARIREKS
jgi:hypothetical protein